MSRESLFLLAIESSCDETGAAVLEGPAPSAGGAPVSEPGAVPRIRSSVIASQFDRHEGFGGVVPEIAAREHVRAIVPVIDRALKDAGVGLDQIGAIAVANRPGLVGSLVVGLTAAKTLALVLDVPLVAVDHLEGHLYACQLAYPERVVYPCIGLVVSGGHTSLYHCEGPTRSSLLGSTIDDAAGEAFDKVAALLHLGFPGGPAVERVAAAGNPRAYDFPRAFWREERLDFSFSGLKTAVLYATRGHDLAHPLPAPSASRTADLAASFQAAVVDVLVEKTRQALDRTGLKRLGIGGGVAANQAFRQRITAMAERQGVEIFLPPLKLCTDNAAMCGIAYEKLALGQTASLDVDVEAGLRRP